jgi:hypothetical protein
MENYIQFSEEITKNKNKLNKSQEQEVSKRLFDYYKNGGDINILAEYLYSFPPSIIGFLFEDNYSNIADEELHKIVLALMEQEKKLKVNGSALWSRACRLISVYLKQNKLPKSFIPIVRISIASIKRNNGEYEKKDVGIFQKYICPYISIFLNLLVMDDWKEFDKARIVKLISTCVNFDYLKKEQLDKWVEDNKLLKYLPLPEEKQVSKQALSTASSNDHPINNNILRIISDLEINAKGLLDNNIRFSREIGELSEQLKAKYQEVDKLTQKITESNEKNKKLNANMNDIARMNQTSIVNEVATLKKDISGSLKNDFLIFQKYKDADYDENILKAFRGCLINVYKKLKSFGINMEEGEKY